jgi:hypothetical protein
MGLFTFRVSTSGFVMWYILLFYVATDNKIVVTNLFIDLQDTN